MTDTATETASDLGPSTGVTPHLTIPSRGGMAAIEFYVQAFGAVELARKYAEDGERLMHCHLKINGASVMLNDEFPEWTGESDVRPRGVTLHVEVADPDCWWARALAQGAGRSAPPGRVLRPPRQAARPLWPRLVDHRADGRLIPRSVLNTAHPREGGDPVLWAIRRSRRRKPSDSAISGSRQDWVPAFAGMSGKYQLLITLDLY